MQFLPTNLISSKFQDMGPVIQEAAAVVAGAAALAEATELA